MSVDSKESNCTMKEELVQGPSSTCDSVALGGATFSSERRGLGASSRESSHGALPSTRGQVTPAQARDGPRADHFG